MNIQNTEFQPCCPFPFLGIGVVFGLVATVGTGTALGLQVQVYQQDSSPTNLTYEVLAIAAVVATSLTCLCSTFFCIRERHRRRIFNRVMPTEDSQSTVLRGAIEIRLHN